ncbi:hypothetical protein D3C78_1584980 [compost metagenome]
MQAHDAEIQFQQAGIAQHLAETATDYTGFAVQHVAAGGRHDRQGDDDTGQCQHGNHPEQRMQAKSVGDYRADHHGDGEGNTEADADECHRFGTVLFPGQIRQ